MLKRNKTLSATSCALFSRSLGVTLFSATLFLSATLISPHNAFAKTNNGNIVVTEGVVDDATSTVIGMETSPSDPILINNGSITATNIVSASLTQALGMYGKHDAGTINYNFSNNGTINATVTSSSGFTTQAFGMSANGKGNHTLSNSGTINATTTFTSTAGGEGAGIMGMLAMSGNEGTGNHTLNNSGTINATATGTAAGTAGAMVIGMNAGGNTGKGNHTLNNSGIINATATVTVTATSDTISVSGMHVEDTGNHTLSNSGIINATVTSSTSNAIAQGMQSGSSAIGNQTLSKIGRAHV